MAGIIYYLLAGTWAGMIAIILFLLGLIFLSSTSLSLHSNHSFGGREGKEGGIARKIVGTLFILIAFSTIAIALIEGKKPVTSAEYQTLNTEANTIPDIKQAIQSYLVNNKEISKIEYYKIQHELELIKRHHYRVQLQVPQTNS